ncbi:hypothetical protein PPL_04328 [Heterostelium album PN500]|uniref:IPT/TIG domain-containing protein n=1 Tax=Heterostelium pallidum (strain ATCC 26659 / Pp 5 / PN500) TaxID=670386 RepID=D3B792_HETP5|nr:hypothetical protein PPL_04328 [Heterostelium album PN500]EFA82635.1 hypothetical protein PPL_04328 [Heterostelium album PN500]|eukprot:XP_020434752.1 hypothetical protein PPL_04328 [Heterostelium album PN500]
MIFELVVDSLIGSTHLLQHFLFFIYSSNNCLNRKKRNSRKTNIMVLQIKLVNILIFIVVGSFLSTIGSVNSQVITFYSPLLGYKFGVTEFTVRGTGFGAAPELYIASTRQLMIKVDVNPSGTSTFVWEIRNPNILDRNYMKIQYGFTVVFPVLPIEKIFFNFITAKINSFTPEFYYPRALDNQVTLTIFGENLILFDNDPKPMVRFENNENQGELKVVSYSKTQIQCTIPNLEENVAMDFSIVVYPQSLPGGVIAPSLFFYTIPLQNQVVPTRGMSNQQQITIVGGPFLEFPQSYAIVVGGQNCTRTICDFVNTQNVQPGTELALPITSTIDGQFVLGLVNYVIFKPNILSFNPSASYSNTEFDISIKGNYLSTATSVLIGPSPCTITSISDNEIICNFNTIGDDLVGDLDVNVYFDGDTFVTGDEQFIFVARPSLLKITPTQIFTVGEWEINLVAQHFINGNYIVINGVEMEAVLITDTLYKVKVDQNTLNWALGDYDLTIHSNYDPNVVSESLTLSVVDPYITINPNFGYYFSETPVEIEFTNFPIQFSPTVAMVATLNNQPIGGNIIILSTQKLGVTVPPCTSDDNMVSVLTIDFTYYLFTISFYFNYLQPSYDSFIKPDLTLWLGGGYFEIHGANLQVITSIQLGDSLLDMSKCTDTTNILIRCEIPSRTPGKYFMVLFAKDSFNIDHPYSNDDELFIEYMGPSLISVSPSRGSKTTRNTLYIDGTNLLDDPTLIQVTVGGLQCNNIQIINPGSQITCVIDPMVKVGELDVIVIVDGVTSDVIGKYLSYSISCLGRTQPDGTNEVVDWWFIYKLANAAGNPYLYIDSKMEKLELYNDLQHKLPIPDTQTNPTFSPLEATFGQPGVTYSIYYNDQTGKRTNSGYRDQSASHDNYGHTKGFTFWEEIGQTINGIHIHHSNPLFPSKANDGNGYNGPKQGIKFLGKNDFSQHFFCYSYNNLELVTEYLVKNYAFITYILGSNAFPDLKDSVPRQQAFPYLYDLLFTKTKSQNLRNNQCEDQIKKGNRDLLNYCYWISNTEVIGNGLKAKYFSKIGTAANENNKLFKDPSRSSYILYKRPRMEFFDGVDLWMVVADTFAKRMFVQMYASKNNYYPGPPKYPMQPTEQILNVSQLELPQYLCPNSMLDSGPRFSYSNNEHAKIAFPIYPTYSSQIRNDNDNYFCVGDNNRHNGQGERGGGAICFQHDTLVYQFNRMVRKYDTLNGANIQTGLSTAVSLFYSIAVPIKLERLGQHPTINCEIKDFIAGEHFSKYPREYTTVLLDTLDDVSDTTLNLQVLRTTNNNVAPAGQSAVPYVGGDNPVEMDVINYYADDIFSLHYIAFDEQVGSICDYDGQISECTIETARVSLIPTTDGPLPDYPPAPHLRYNMVTDKRNFSLNDNEDFNILSFTQSYKASSFQGGNIIFNYVINENIVGGGYYDPPRIFRQTSGMCDEELAYYMTLHFLYTQSPNTNSLIYNVGEYASPNWANGVVYAISKKLLNHFYRMDTTQIEQCFSVVDGFTDIENNQDDDGSMEDPDDSVLFKRSASAAWAWMNPNYDDGSNAGRASDDSVPLVDLANLLRDVLQDQDHTIVSLSNFYDHIGVQYRTDLNFITILQRYYLIPVAVNEGSDFNMVQIKMPVSSFFKIPTQQLLSIDELSTKTGVQQLIATQLVNESDIVSLNIYQIEKLGVAIDKWISINGQSQAIQVLIKNPVTQYHNQPIKFIQELNHYQHGNTIDLKSQAVGTTGTKITLTSPLSISSITFILESIIMSKSTTKTKLGDLEVYYLPKPETYKGYITSDYDGMIISTINSQLCDIQMVQQSDFLSNNFDVTCSGVGPIITSVNILDGITDGGYQITLSGIRFNSSMIISIDDKECLSTVFISSEELVCQVPSGIEKYKEIQISTQQTIFNIQRSKFLFSYGTPVITNVEPEIIKSYGSDFMTITGSNFGNDITKVQVLIDEKLDCTIDVLTQESIICLTPPAIGDHRSVTVIVDDQRTILNIDTLEQQSFSFRGPEIIKFVPASGDPNDKIIILGDGFGSSEDNDLPPLLYIGDNLVQIDNFTYDFIEFDLEYDTSTQPLIIQSGDQTISSQFTYYPAILTQLNNSDITTTGGLIEIQGIGLGISYEYVEIYLNSVEIDCNAFNEFIECMIPAGIGRNIILTATLSDEPIDLADNYTISYNAPKILSVLRSDVQTLEINGSDFVPVDLGVAVNPTTSNIKLLYNDRTEICTSFKSSEFAECPFSDDMPTAVQVMFSKKLETPDVLASYNYFQELKQCLSANKRKICERASTLQSSIRFGDLEMTLYL